MKPILFNTEMVQAILDSKKTVTRRCIKGLDRNALFIGWKTSSGNEKSYGTATFELDGHYIDCKPKYLIGDQLYVRETWSELKNNDKSHKKYVYKATDTFPFEKGDFANFRWHPSIHMPKEAARLFLRVTDVRIEQMSDMLESDCEKEGIRTFTKDGILKKYAVCEKWWENYHRSHKNLFRGTPWQDMPTSIFKAFSFFWDSTQKKSELLKYGWSANPWVWVYEFELISKEEAMKESEVQ